jgi:hypothetical protein
MTVTVLSIVCTLLVLTTGIMIWYVRRLISTLDEVYGLVKIALGAIIEYEEHLERVYSMDTFYGDNTLESLLEHSRDLKKGLQDLVSTSEDFFGDAPEEEGIDA